MPYDATKMADWQISEAAEEKMPTPDQWREKLGLQKDEVIPMGKLAKLDFLKIIERLKDKPDGKYIEVTAITPTPLGEGKSTTSLGRRMPSPAVRRTHHERKGHCCRRRQRASHSHDRVFARTDR
jgi:formyltetrahydrofolate synthetase